MFSLLPGAWSSGPEKILHWRWGQGEKVYALELKRSGGVHRPWCVMRLLPRRWDTTWEGYPRNLGMTVGATMSREEIHS